MLKDEICLLGHEANKSGKTLNIKERKKDYSHVQVNKE